MFAVLTPYPRVVHQSMTEEVTLRNLDLQWHLPHKTWETSPSAALWLGGFLGK